MEGWDKYPNSSMLQNFFMNHVTKALKLTIVLAMLIEHKLFFSVYILVILVEPL